MSALIFKPKLRANATRRSRWLDLVVRVGIVLALGYFLGQYFLPRYLGHEPTDRQRWLARPRLEPNPSIVATNASVHTSIPCFFVLPAGAVDQPVSSESVADCLTLVPDGKKLDLIELNLASGELFPIATDVYVPGSMPLAFTRTYYPSDDWARKFHVHLPHVYDPYLTASRFPYTYTNWLLPDRQTIHFERISPGTGYADYIAESKSSDPSFAGSRIAWNGWGWDLAMPDGGTYLSPEAYNAIRPQQGSLTGIFDKDGREVRLTRAQNGDLQEIRSPDGQWIRIGYNTAGQIVRATNDSGQFVDYGYDPENRPQTVRYSDGRTVTYSYSPLNSLASVVDPSRSLELSVKYNGQGMPSELILNGESIELRYFVDQIDKVKRRANAHVDILKSHGATMRIRIVFAQDGVLLWTAERPGGASPGG